MIAFVCCRFQLFHSFVAANICIWESITLDKTTICIIRDQYSLWIDGCLIIGLINLRSNEMNSLSIKSCLVFMSCSHVLYSCFALMSCIHVLYSCVERGLINFKINEINSLRMWWHLLFEVISKKILVGRVWLDIMPCISYHTASNCTCWAMYGSRKINSQYLFIEIKF